MTVFEIRIIVERSENGVIFTIRIEERDQFETESGVTGIFSKVG